MKLAAAALAAAALVAPPSAAAASQVVKDIKVVGSDAGACKFFEDGNPGCDANFVLIATEFADGTVKGQLNDVVGDDKGKVKRSGSAECVRIYEDESRDYTVAVVAGTWDVDDPKGELFEAGDAWWTFAAIDDDGTPYYTAWWPSEIKSLGFGPYEDADEICDNAEEAAGFLLQAGFFFEHFTGQVTIDKLACEDLPSEKKCGKFLRQCKWEEEEEACVELGACEVARTQPECRALGFECRWDGEEEACVENLVEYATAAKEPHSAGATAKVSMLAIVPATLLWLFD